MAAAWWACRRCHSPRRHPPPHLLPCTHRFVQQQLLLLGPTSSLGANTAAAAPHSSVVYDNKTASLAWHSTSLVSSGLTAHAPATRCCSTSTCPSRREDCLSHVALSCARCSMIVRARFRCVCCALSALSRCALHVRPDMPVVSCCAGRAWALAMPTNHIHARISWLRCDCLQQCRDSTLASESSSTPIVHFDRPCASGTSYDSPSVVCAEPGLWQ